MSKWNVGDEIIVQHRNYGRGEARVTTEVITKVARKYFYVGGQPGEWKTTAFEVATGREKNNGTNYHGHAYTPEDWEAEQFRGGLLKRMRDEHRVSFGYTGTWREPDWSNEHLLELIDLLDRVRARKDGGE